VPFFSPTDTNSGARISDGHREPTESPREPHEKTSPALVAKGEHGAYQWLTTEFEADGLARLCPKIVLGKYLAVASFDSGSSSLSDEEKANGWRLRNGIAYSPRTEAISGLPRTDGWDEWYVFESQTELGALCHTNPFDPRPGPGQVHAYVNSNVALHDGETGAVLELFWEQMNWIKPESFLGESEQYLRFATRNKNICSAILQSLSNASSTGSGS
jgi:hypothetical protein